jgi:hypothetical protein
MKEKRVQVFVYPGFHKILKTQAAEKGTTIIDLTKQLSYAADPLERLVRDTNEKFKKKKTLDFF